MKQKIQIFLKGESPTLRTESLLIRRLYLCNAYRDDNGGGDDDDKLFCGVTVQRRSFSLISKWDHGQRFSRSQTSFRVTFRAFLLPENGSKNSIFN